MCDAPWVARRRLPGGGRRQGLRRRELWSWLLIRQVSRGLYSCEQCTLSTGSCRTSRGLERQWCVRRALSVGAAHVVRVGWLCRCCLSWGCTGALVPLVSRCTGRCSGHCVAPVVVASSFPANSMPAMKSRSLPVGMSVKVSSRCLDAGHSISIS